MHHRIVSPTLRRALMVALALAAGTAAAFAIPAFPGAEGFGQNAIGGRGASSTVYHVTNLNDTGAGSFRDAVSVANRIVVFDVGGIIRINSVVAVKNNITIAGQTAPGGGITVYGNRVSFSDAHNTICRYIRIREGINGDSGTDAVGIASGHDMIFDHVSASWGRDETFSISGSAISNITLQDCIVGQGLLVHSAGGLVQTGGGVSIFRTLYTDNWMRNPKIKGVNDYQNNVVYNWGSGGGYIPAGDSAGDTYANMIGNYFIGGFDSGIGTSPFKTGNDKYRLFHANNREDLNLDGALNGTTVTDASFPTLQIVGTQFAYPAPRILLTPEQALQHIVTYAGASYRRDTVDTDMINEVLSYGTDGKQIFNESEVGGVGIVAPASTAVIDTDNDGMPDWWEQVAGTNPVVADNNGDIDGDGYSNIENYINSLAVTGVPQLSIIAIATDTGVSATDGITVDGTLVINGTAPVGATVQVSRVDTGVLGTAVADGSGYWSYDYTAVALPQRYYGFKATLDLGGGNFSLSTPAAIVNVDNTAPAAPVITSLVTSPDYIFTGTAEIFATVNVTLEGVGIVATTTADGFGNWIALYNGAPLSPGLYNFTAAATDLAGNTGVSSGTYAVNTALTAPVFTSIADDTGVSSSDQITNDTLLTLNGTAPATSTVTITRVGTGVIGNAVANGSGLWSFPYGTTLASGQYTFTATASSGGSSSPASAPFLVTVDTVAPTIDSIIRLNPTTAATTATTLFFRVTFAEPVINVDLNDFALTKAAGITGGNLTLLTPVNSRVYDVKIENAAGDGTIRLDRAANSTIRDFANNAGSSGTYTGGQSYTMRLAGSGVWMSTESGDLWSDSSNWENSVVADGSGTTADFSTRDIDDNVLVRLDASRTVGRLVFGDADLTTTGTWTISNYGVASKILTLAGGTPTIQVNGLVTSGTDTVDVPAANAYPYTLDTVLAGTTLNKTGVGTLQITKPATLTGALTITKGVVQIADGGSYSPSSVTLLTSQQLRIVGGSFSTGTVSYTTSGTGSLVLVAGGNASFAKIASSNQRNGIFSVTGGVATIGEIDFPRSGDSEVQAIAAGVRIGGGDTTVGLVGLGTADSWGALTMTGGKFTVTDTINTGFQKTSTRGGVITLSGGEFNVTNSTAGKGLILARNPGGANANTNNVAKLIMTGGVANIARMTLGFDATSSAGSATVTVTNSELNLGSGGIVKNGTSGLVSSLTFNSGVLGAFAPWSTTHPLVLAGTPATFAIRAGTAAAVPFDIALNGALSGAGGFVKTGAGTLTLGAANTFAGNLDLNAGTLLLNGSLAAGGTFNVNSGGLLIGTGTSNKAIVLNNGGTISPGMGAAGTLTAASLAWNGDGSLAFDLGVASDKITIGGALTKGTAGAHAFAFTPAGPLVIGTNYTLATFGTTDFAAADFSATGLGYGKGQFSVGAGVLQFTITSDGTGRICYNAWAAGYAFPAGLDGAAADADGDGQSNLLEFILGQNPLSAGVENVKLITLADDGVDYPALRFTRRIARGDIGVEVRVSTDLDFSSTLGAVEVSAINQGDGTELVTVRSVVSYAVQPKQFLRLDATLP